jgi:hypothetical protein
VGSCLTPGEPVFTDGSVRHARFPQLVVAASVAAQKGRDGVQRVIAARVPSELPVTSTLAEHYAFAIACSGLARLEPDGVQGISIITDGASVVLASRARNVERDPK